MLAPFESRTMLRDLSDMPLQHSTTQAMDLPSHKQRADRALATVRPPSWRMQVPCWVCCGAQGAIATWSCLQERPYLLALLHFFRWARGVRSRGIPNVLPLALPHGKIC